MQGLQAIHTEALCRHVHAEPYAALVLSGSYEEAGDAGRFQVGPGDVVFHSCFEGHLNRFPSAQARVLNFALPPAYRFCTGLARIADPDHIARLAEMSRQKALEQLCNAALHHQPSPADWPDLLASELRQNPSLSLSRWGNQHGLAAWQISRGFTQVFGLTAEAFRARARAHLALTSILTTHQPFAAIAAHLGFADQAHMSRSIRQLTGQPPRCWRSSANTFKTPPFANA